MLTKTTESAIQALLYLAMQDKADPVSPRQIARELGQSPTYLAKTANLLVKANILKAHRGALGGMTLGRAPEKVTLLEIIEACQGQVVGDYCQEVGNLKGVCAFHHAMREVHRILVETLSKWTLADLVAQPGPATAKFAATCRMTPVRAAGNRS